MTPDASLFEEVVSPTGRLLTTPTKMTPAEEQRYADAVLTRIAAHEATARRDAVIRECAKTDHRVRYDQYDAMVGRTLRRCAVCDEVLHVI